MNRLGTSLQVAAHPPYYTGWARDGACFDHGGVGILMYHKVSAPLPHTRWPSLYVEGGTLRRQLVELREAGIPCVPYDDAWSATRSGARTFSITFDDGFLSVYETALPILQDLGLTACLFLVSSLIGRTDEWDHAIGEGPHPLMNAAHVRAWLAAGHEIGAHTMTHPSLTQLSPARAREEIFGSKAALEDQFGVAIRHFCYPYGHHDKAVRDLVAEAGFVDAPSTAPGVNGLDADPFQLRRLWCTEANAT